MPTESQPLNTARVETVGHGPVDIAVFDDFSAIEKDWKQLQIKGVCSLYQRYEWVKTWCEHVSSTLSMQPRLVIGISKGKPLFILPLSIRKKGPFTVVCWLGDSHTNFYMGLYSRRFIQKTEIQDMRDLMESSLVSLGRADALLLNSQPLKWQGFDNPLSFLDRQNSHNHAFALNLEGGFEAAINRKNGPRKRKKYRWQHKCLSDVGGATLRVATSKNEVDSLLDISFEQMAVRFRQAGIWNRFEDEGVTGFIRDVAKSSLQETEPQLVVYGLEIDGKIRATFAGGVHRGQFSGCFISMADDEYLYLSPGELIIYLVVQDCAARGLICFDLGLGEERYKISWCDLTIAMFETHLSLSLWGIPLVAYERGKTAIKGKIHGNDRLWTFAKKTRARLFGRN